MRAGSSECMYKKEADLENTKRGLEESRRGIPRSIINKWREHIFPR